MTRIVIALALMLAGALVLLLVPGSRTPEVSFVVRLLHIVTGIGWLGEVVTVNFVLLPALAHADPTLRARLLQAVFPYVFRLATVLAGLAVISGLGLFILLTGGNVGSVIGTPWGSRILIGGVLGAALLIFHLVQESGWEGSLASRLSASANDPAQSEIVLRRLRIAPRAGLAVILVTVVLMSSAARLP